MCAISSCSGLHHGNPSGKFFEEMSQLLVKNQTLEDIINTKDFQTKVWWVEDVTMVTTISMQELAENPDNWTQLIDFEYFEGKGVSERAIANEEEDKAAAETELDLLQLELPQEERRQSDNGDGTGGSVV
jgi:hypothetical protein